MARTNSALKEAYQELLSGLPEERREVAKFVNAAGRPSLYSDELAETICQRMVDGENLMRICADPAMPTRMTIYNWMERRPDFYAKYLRAKDGLADWHFSRIDTVVDECTNEDVQRARLLFDAHKWLAEKLSPRQYGPQKQHVEITGAIDMQVSTLDVRALSLEQREQLKALLIAARDASTMKTIEHDPGDQ